MDVHVTYVKIVNDICLSCVLNIFIFILLGSKYICCCVVQHYLECIIYP